MSTVPEANGTVKFDQQLTSPASQKQTDTRQVWRQAVAEVAARATATLPACTGRIEKAVSLVLAGDVEVLGDGTARVASQANGQTVYHIVNGHCDCKDYPHAYEGWCKHRLSAAIAKRAYPLAKAQWDAASAGQDAPGSQAAPAPDVPVTPLPEAPVSITLKASLDGHEVLVTLRGTDFASVKTQVEAASAWLKAHAPAPRSAPPRAGARNMVYR